MTATHLLADIRRLGIRLEAKGNRLRYYPRTAVSPEMIVQLKERKGELLALLKHPKDAIGIHAKASPDTVPEMTVTAGIGLGPDGWPLGCIDPDELSPCPNCGSLEQWQTLGSNWQCQHCNPPEVPLRLLKFAERVRRRAMHRTTTRQKGQYRR